MCGIAGLIWKVVASSDIGTEMTQMLQALRHRGPDSTGFALYGKADEGVQVLRFKVAEQEEMKSGFDIHRQVVERRAAVDTRLKELGAEVTSEQQATEYAFRYHFKFSGDLKRLIDFLEDLDGVEFFSVGKALELIKDMGDAAVVSEQYGIKGFVGTHALGHTRMATESDVDIRSAHPYWAYPFNDVSVVHNGQLTNYWSMRRDLEHRGHRFVSNCDSELIAVYIADAIDQGEELEGAMRRSIDVIDGVFTYLVATSDQLGMAKDVMSAKPMVLYESDEFVGLASEEVAIRSIFPREIDTWDPYQGEGESMGSVTSGSASHKLGLHEESLAGRTQQRFFSASEEENFVYPWSYEVDPDKQAEFDAADMEITDINNKIRELMKSGHGTITVQNPRAKHSLGVGILNRLNLNFEGSLGYFGAGLTDGANIRISGRVGWSCAENMMSGTVVIEKNAGSLFGAAIRGGDLVCKVELAHGWVIDQKGGTIIVGDSVGAFTGFMMQRGRMIILGDAGDNLGDSMYDGTIYVGGKIASLGVDCVETELTDLDIRYLKGKLDLYGMSAPNGVENMVKLTSGKQLWNYDNLEASEKKLVL